MPRIAAFATTVLFVAAAHAQEPLAADPAAAAEPAVEGIEPADATVEDFADDEGEEEYEGEDVEYCGGGDEEPTAVQLASFELEEERFMRARRMIVEALRNGQVDEWERPYALSVLAEAQLNLREYRHAAVNYRKSLRIDPESAPASRVGLATALFMGGQSSAAHQEAIDAREALCSDQWSYVACFGAQAVLSRTATDATEREAATQAMQTIRAAHPDNAEQFDRAVRRLERRRAARQ